MEKHSTQQSTSHQFFQSMSQTPRPRRSTVERLRQFARAAIVVPVGPVLVLN